MNARRLFRQCVMVGLCLVIAGAASVSGQTTERTEVLDFALHAENPVLSRGPEGAWDQGTIWLGCVLHHEDQFHMFYAGAQRMSDAFSIGYATSENGINWNKHPDNPVFVVDEEIYQYGLYGGPCVVQDDEWTMYVQPRISAGYNAGLVVMRATAPAPTGPWMLGEVILTEQENTWDRGITPTSITITANETILYYGAGSPRDFAVSGIGRATSTDGVTFTRYDDPTTDEVKSLPAGFTGTDPVVASTDEGWDATLDGGFVLPLGDGWEMFYAAFGPDWASPGQIGYATSPDGISWTRQADPLPLEQGILGLWHPQVVVVDDTYYLYMMDNPSLPIFQDIHLATGTITRE